MNVREFIVVTTTTPTRDAADRIACAIVTQRLAACAQVSGPIASTYWWKGVIESATEWRIEMKTRATLCAPLAAAIAALHPYETPQIVAVPLCDGGTSYLEWLEEETAAHS